MANPAVDIRGQSFGSLTVLEKAPTRGHNAYWECLCSCSKKVVVSGPNLRSGKTRSCGCRRRAKRPDKKNPALVLTDVEAAVRRVLTEYRTAAKKFGRAFELTYGDVERLTLAVCHYCGDLPLYGPSPRTAARNKVPLNGIDRVDSALGYTVGNVVPCCKHCNLAKRDRSAHDFIEHCRKIVAHQDAGV